MRIPCRRGAQPTSGMGLLAAMVTAAAMMARVMVGRGVGGYATLLGWRRKLRVLEAVMVTLKEEGIHVVERQRKGLREGMERWAWELSGCCSGCGLCFECC